MTDEVIQVRTAATLGYLDELPKSYLTEKNFLLQDEDGWSAVHYACESGNLHMVPKRFITEAALLTPTKDGKTALHLVSEFSLVPAEVLTPTNIVIKDKDGRTPLHRAACFGTLSQLTPELLTCAQLSAADNCGCTVFHEAAKHCYLDQLPVLPLHALLLQDNEGETPLHLLMQRDSLPEVVVTLLSGLTADSILVQNNLGYTPLHYARVVLEQLPKTFLTAKAVMQPNSFGATPLDNWLEWNCVGSLLGVDFGDAQEVRKKVGDGWWQKNHELLCQRTSLEGVDAQHEIYIF